MEGKLGQDKIIDVEDKKALEKGLEIAGDILTSGGVVAFPTESFYGLAVNAMDEKAIQRLFIIKKRGGTHPVLILIPSIDSLMKYIHHIPDCARKLMPHFWPGGLTLIFKARPNISPLLTAETGKIGVRLSSHPIARALPESINNPITGTSANISGQTPCISANDVIDQLGREIDLVLDYGETRGGPGSTILDVTTTPPRILREGMVSKESISVILGGGSI